MTQYISTIEAGPFLRIVRYPAASGRRRAGRTQGVCDETTDWRQNLNDRHSWEALSTWLHAYYHLDSQFVTLTYNDDHLPPNYEAAKRLLTAVLRRFRGRCREAGCPHSYIYVLEGMHGDRRMHHHVVLPRGPQAAMLMQLWTYGTSQAESIRDFASHSAPGEPALSLSEYIRSDGPLVGPAKYEHACFCKLAKYMTKEPRKTGRVRPGGRAYTPSRDHLRPRKVVVEAEGSLVVPPGYVVISEGYADSSFGPVEAKALYRVSTT